MKKNIKLIVFSLIISSICFMSCKQESGKSDHKQIYTLIDQCFLVRGISGELLDLHILRDKENNVSVRTSLSALSSDNRMLDEDLPDFIVIANNVDIIDNSFRLLDSKVKYWIFEASIEDPVILRASPGNDGGNTVSAKCLCGDGSEEGCVVTQVVNDPGSYSFFCKPTSVGGCSGEGNKKCNFKDQTENIKARVKTQNTTTIIIESDKIDYNGLLYK